MSNFRGCRPYHVAMWRLLVVLGCAIPLGAVELPLAGPLSTRIAAPPTPLSAGILTATVRISDDAPGDLGCSAWAADAHGRWWQVGLPDVRGPGIHQVRIDLRAAALAPIGHTAPWNAANAAEAHESGLLFYTAGAGGRVAVDGLAITEASTLSSAHRLHLLQCPASAIATGERWELRLRPEPYPADPFDPDQFAVTLEATAPDGAVRRLAGFHDQPMRSVDRGDREELAPDGEQAFAVRLRATVPGIHRLRLLARWKDGSTATCELPAITATGAPNDRIARVDRGDPRFFSDGDGRPVWPVGPGLHSIWDPRGLERMGSQLTPPRGSLSYRAYLDRLATSGATATEIWLCSWNLALAWRADWWPWHGATRLSEERAWQLDQVLETAERHGIRVNLVVQNHGQASEHTDREWENNPANRDAGGWLESADLWFSDPRALQAQERYRRYLIARYADSPAILGWKMWSEVNLTELGHLSGGGGGQDRADPARELLRSWHAAAAARWAALDPWAHPVTTHWSGDYNTPDRAIAGLPGISYVCIDAYHGPEHGLWRLLCASTQDPATRSRRGLAELGKPVLVTEFGGNWDGAPPERMHAEHAMGAWIAMVSGHAGAPMLWWHEWVDQNALFAPYRAITAYLAGEDLRGAERSCTMVRPEPDTLPLWSRAWTGKGRMLGYALDTRWGMAGGDAEELSGAGLLLGDPVGAGRMRLQWWDADSGIRISERAFDHPGGRLVIAAPAFRRHIAFKLWRE